MQLCLLPLACPLLYALQLQLQLLVRLVLVLVLLLLLLVLPLERACCVCKDQLRLMLALERDHLGRPVVDEARGRLGPLCMLVDRRDHVAQLQRIVAHQQVLRE
jgi:hypothetical protein